ncbi:aminoglycoside phosphotransferase family protein [Legionella waltersii]|uniref:Spectinomycin phosphotransferase n=1 Tax=Legionella waltersii TaxID=66969 RepID=A0A0W1A268_9GAMM|nr:aminoglycoside phosphotransferase family protein [Legionella waltersii]KTD75107.1 spectinomycin phosphotransferase [Legionella waltersii]SNV05063.1 spectinomycin phosphotransferase [Legionella waltersii]
MNNLPKTKERKAIENLDHGGNHSLANNKLMMTKPIPEQELIELLKSHYGLCAYSAKILPLGADMNASIYKAETHSNSYFVKIIHDVLQDSPIEIMKLLHDSGIKHIISPIKSLEGKLVKILPHFKLIVYPFIEGENGFDRKLTKTEWIELGRVLKQIHSIQVPAAIQSNLRTEDFSTKWIILAGLLHDKINANTINSDVNVEFKRFFNDHFDKISRLIHSAKVLSKSIQSTRCNNVLCHSDIHAGNILINSQETFYIIDWDNPIMAPKERDLMFIGGGVGNVWNIPQESSYFFEGYGKAQINDEMLSYYRYVRILEDVVLYAEDILSPKQHDQSKRLSLYCFKSQFEENGVIDIAFRSF